MSLLHALSSPPPVGWGLWSFWLAPPRLGGAVCSTEIWYGCCRLLALMSSLHARYHTKCDVALFSLQTVPRPCSDAVLRSCEEALAGIILHRPPSLWFAWVRSGCAGPLGAGAARGPPGGGGLVSPLACHVGSCLVWPCCFPRLVLFGLVPSLFVEWGVWSFWLAPPRLWGAVCSTGVWYGCCRLLVVMSSLHALSPPPPHGVGPVVVLVGPAPPGWGSVFYRDTV